MESTITGAGIGLFANRNIGENQIFTTYDGPQSTKAQHDEFKKGTWNSDYVAQLISDRVTGEVIMDKPVIRLALLLTIPGMIVLLMLS